MLQKIMFDVFKKRNCTLSWLLCFWCHHHCILCSILDSLLPYSIKPKKIWHVDSEKVFKKFLWCTFFLPLFEKAFNVLSSSFNRENYLYFDISSKLSLFRSVSQQINTCSKSTIKTAERHYWHRPSVFIVKVERNLFLLLTLNK